MDPKARLLIAEDEGLVAMSMEMFLTDMGHEVCAIATTAPEAVELTERWHPELVLMDLRLAGGTDGLAAAREIKRRFGVPSILLTGTAGLEAVDAREAGALGVLRKPYEPSQLASAIETAIQASRNESFPSEPPEK